MVQCPTCLTAAPDQSRSCATCGGVLPLANAAAANGHDDATGLLTREINATVALPASSRSTPSSRSPGTSRPSITSTTEDDGRFVPGTLVAGRYRVIGLLGRGGMGEVYRATDLTLGQSVALKFLPEDAARNERLLERFHNEVRTARQVSHANVCRVYDIGEAEGLPFISMEYVDGEDLASLLQRIGRLPSAKALEITRKLCAGLAAAHERGIMHRDLKPHNVMLNKRGEVVIMDFGLAAIADELQGFEARNGTPAYMAPEQLRGDSVTARSDIYSLGLIAYELFTGKRAFEAASSADLLRQKETTRPPGMTSVVHDVDPAVEEVITRCLSPEPSQRPVSALAVAAALPGGDALAAALAAGEMPSPELVAASGKTEGFPLRFALPCLLVVLAGLIAVPMFFLRTSMLAMIPMDYPPEVLQQKARDTAALLGYAAKPGDSTMRLYRRFEVANYFRDRRGSRSWRELLTAESPVMLFYRQSPQLLRSFPDGNITWDRPAPIEPGMLQIELDSKGQLRAFQAIAPRYDAEPPATEVDAATIFRQAGFDLARFEETAPRFAPPNPFDSRRAWKGTHPAIPDLKLTVEIAAWRGVLTNFHIVWPWTRTEATPSTNVRDLSFTAWYMFVCAAGLLISLFLARRNLRLGRGDPKGAIKLAFTAVVLSIVAWLARMHVIPDLALMNFAFENISVALAMGAILWLLYMALEPLVRARWPHSLITWNRVLAGQFRDPRVGSHILLGAALAVVIMLLFMLRSQLMADAGAPPAAMNLDPLLGFRPFVQRVSDRALNAVMWGMAMFLMISAVRVVVRRDWLAAILAGLPLTFVEGSVRSSTNLPLDVTLYMVMYVAFALIFLRVGLVTAIVTLFVLNSIGDIPVSGQFSAWYNWVALLNALLVAGIAAYGFWRSQASSRIRERYSV